MFRQSRNNDPKGRPQEDVPSSKRRVVAPPPGSGANSGSRAGSIDMDLSGRNSPKESTSRAGFIGPTWIPAGANAGGTYEVMSTMPLEIGNNGGAMNQISMGGSTFSSQSVGTFRSFLNSTMALGDQHSTNQPQYSMAQQSSGIGGLPPSGYYSKYGLGGTPSGMMGGGGYPPSMIGGMAYGGAGSLVPHSSSGNQNNMMSNLVMSGGGNSDDPSNTATSSHTPMLDLSSYGNPAMPSYAGGVDLNVESMDGGGGLDGSGGGLMSGVPPLPPPDPSLMFSMMAGMTGYVPSMGQFDFHHGMSTGVSGELTAAIGGNRSAIGFPGGPTLQGMAPVPMKSDCDIASGGNGGTIPMVPSGLPGGILPPDGMTLPGGMMPGGTGEGPAAVGLSNGAIKFRDSVLYPPHPNFTIIPTRERPPVCRTIFVGGVPENCNEEVLRDVFESCGDICSVRLKASKNFAHIRFTNQDSVDRALYFSGYRIRINDRSDKEWSGRLHIDFAQDRDDQQEWEIQQKALRQSRAPSPPKAVRFSEREAASLIEQLKNVESFPPSVSILQTWLDRGDCSKKTSATFYSMIGAVNAHIRRLTADRSSFIAEMIAFRDRHNERLQKIMTELDAIREVFVAARKQKNWDHFTKPQRKNLEAWIKMVEDMHHEHETEMLQDRQEMEMEESDEEVDEGPSGAKKARTDRETIVTLTADLAKAQENFANVKAENSLMRAQMDAVSQENSKLKTEAESFHASSSEPEVVKSESDDPNRKEIEISTLRKTLQGIQEKLMATAQQLQSRESEIEEIKKSNSALKAELSSMNDKPDSSSGTSVIKALPEPALSVLEQAHDDKLIALISIFLHVHPFGASVDYICSYLNCILRNIRSRDIETTMERHPQLFKLSTVGVGASIERKWTFLAYSAD